MTQQHRHPYINCFKWTQTSKQNEPATHAYKISCCFGDHMIHGCCHPKPVSELIIHSCIDCLEPKICMCDMHIHINTLMYHYINTSKVTSKVSMKSQLHNSIQMHILCVNNCSRPLWGSTGIKRQCQYNQTTDASGIFWVLVLAVILKYFISASQFVIMIDQHVRWQWTINDQS